MEKGETTKFDIIQKAAPIFNHQGYAGASIADVMKATGLQKGGIYNHFNSKEQLALETFNYSVRLVRQHYVEALKGHDSAPNQLIAFMTIFQQFFDTPPIPGGCPLLNRVLST